ncbi:VQ motif-containing protein 10-like [Abrus precatorius]|uniref:VQ motif-containing protein 10-like n=1 Tax=Abrus precatorius TaxID=3816 RepID=A0A8B8KHN3_ABRPR|nr:VQ motif-containing protein 10-like [Abrus precatorius]
MHLIPTTLKQVNNNKKLIMTTAPKIVHIETRYVETEAVNFRDVVQRLTGKNSSLVASSDHSKVITSRDGVCAKPEEHATPISDGNEKSSVLSSMVLMNLSFKDFEGFLSDMPSMEELLLL